MVMRNKHGHYLIFVMIWIENRIHYMMMSFEDLIENSEERN